MTSACLSAAELEQVLRAMSYWRIHWDWECPTLFGIELEDLEQVIRSWPDTTPELREKRALAAIGSLRELLYGASTPQRDKLPSILGLDYIGAGTLCTKVHSLYRFD